MIFIPEGALPAIIGILIIVLVFLAIRAVFHFIKWLISSIWGLLTGQKKENQYGPSDYWLDKAQAKQEIRFQNAAPPLREEAKPHKQTFRERWNESKGLSPTGWKFNEETQLWESPEQQKMKK